MPTPLGKSGGRRGLKTSSVDLSAIAKAHPVNSQVAVLDLNTFDATQLTLLEVLDMAETVGVDPEAMGALLESGAQSSKRMRLLYAMAWCVARRDNPALTFAEVCTWRLEVIGEVSEETTEKTAKRAKAIVGAAAVTGLPPREAGSLTLAELGAYADRNRAARRRRRAG
jgi:hypothetical protein